ncbi:DUF3006 domain-containing protein [Clostridium sp.]|uniref:DUF3006 domain-containing protein n=1 Tax=Clostridium sp. TaxID=1506 RepID=UPI002634CC9F|nr:DUF3006 domain-containing protein [Clostridium sp.]
MHEKYIIDRVESSYVIVEKENGEMDRISLDSIQGDFKEGDILINKDEYFEIDESLTVYRKREIDKIVKDMWEE